MKVIKDDIISIKKKVAYIHRNEYECGKLNTFFNNWYLFVEKESEIRELIKYPLETILYSKFYWCSRFKEEHEKMFGKDAGIEQQHYKIVEEMSQRIPCIDWELIQKIEEDYK